MTCFGTYLITEVEEVEVIWCMVRVAHMYITNPIEALSGIRRELEKFPDHGNVLYSCIDI